MERGTLELSGCQDNTLYKDTQIQRTGGIPIYHGFEYGPEETGTQNVRFRA